MKTLREVIGYDTFRRKIICFYKMKQMEEMEKLLDIFCDEESSSKASVVDDRKGF